LLLAYVVNISAVPFSDSSQHPAGRLCLVSDVRRFLLKKAEKKTIALLYPIGYNLMMVEIRQTEVFADWFRGLRDHQSRARVQVRIDRLQLGLPGDVKPVGEGVSELRVDYGPGYRVYFT
jgi:hypothetical protein